MSEEEINVAIAECCGYAVRGLHPRHGGMTATEWPNYCGDLNAMHEAEKELGGLDWPYAQALFQVLEGNGILSSSTNAIRAKASHRAEAFLRALSKWRE